MAQNFWMAIFSWTTCFVVTIVISLATPRKKTDDELRGLVYSLTPRFDHDDHLAWYAKPEALAVVDARDYRRLELYLLVRRRYPCSIFAFPSA